MMIKIKKLTFRKILDNESAWGADGFQIDRISHMEYIARNTGSGEPKGFRTLNAAKAWCNTQVWC